MMRAFMLAAALAAAVSGAQAQMTSTQSAAKNGSIPQYGAFEAKLTYGHAFKNAFREGVLRAEFVSPSGKTIAAEGFYDGGNDWRVRFVPREHGKWTWKAALLPAGSNAALHTAQGQFECQGTAGHGFLTISKKNPFRFEYEDGTPFYPIGIQTCSFLQPDFDGPDENGRGRSATTDEWLTAFAGAVNLVRTQFGQGTQAGCAQALIAAPPRVRPGEAPPTAAATPPLDQYDLVLAKKLDETYFKHRAAGISQILILYQDMSLWGGGGSGFGGGRDLSPAGYKRVDAANMPLQEQYIRYVVARYGCFVDVWELFNEDSFAPDDYLAHLAKVVRQADPHGRLVTTNYARYKADWCDFLTWHEYMGMKPSEVDAYLVSQIALYKSHGKLVQNTEFGNQGQLSNYDPVKWRIAVWTAFMNESGLLFWGMSGSKVPAGRKGATGNANAYIGPDSRQHFRVLGEFTKGLPVDMKPVPIGYHEHTAIRAYGLSNGKMTVMYIHHFADHGQEHKEAAKLMVQTGPGKFRVTWINPEDGKQVKTEELSTAQQFLSFDLPPVKIDLAAKVERLD